MSSTVQQEDFKSQSSKSSVVERVLIPFCCLGKPKTKGDIKPKHFRKYSLRSVAEEANSDKEIRLQYERVCNRINRIKRENNMGDGTSTTLPICNDEVSAQLMSLKKEKEEIYSRIKTKKKQDKKSACRQFLRQQMNQLKDKRDFDDFMKSIEIGSLEDEESISDTDDNQMYTLTPSKVTPAKNRDLNRNIFRRERNHKKKKLDFNDIFKVIDTKLHDCENPFSCSKDAREIQSQLTNASPINHKDTRCNKRRFFDSFNPSTNSSLIKDKRKFSSKSRGTPGVEF